MSELRDILDPSCRVQDVVGKLRNWMKINPTENMNKLQNYVSTLLNDMMSHGFAFILFCASVDSLTRALSVSHQSIWQDILTSLVQCCSPSEKEKITLKKYIDICRNRQLYPRDVIFQWSTILHLPCDTEGINSQEEPARKRTRENVDRGDNCKDGGNTRTSKAPRHSPPASQSQTDRILVQSPVTHLINAANATILDTASSTAGSSCTNVGSAQDTFLGNSMHTFRAAHLLQRLCRELRMESIVEYAAYEILHAMALLPVCADKSGAFLRRGQRSQGWLESETPAVVVSCAMLAAKIHSDAIRVPNKGQIEDAFYRVVLELPVFRAPLDMDDMVYRFEKRGLVALQYDFRFADPLAEVTNSDPSLTVTRCGQMLMVPQDVITRAHRIWQHEVFWLTNVSVRCTANELAIAMMVFAQDKSMTILHNYCKEFRLSVKYMKGMMDDMTYLKNEWLPLMQDHLQQHVGRLRGKQHRRELVDRTRDGGRGSNADSTHLSIGRLSSTGISFLGDSSRGPGARVTSGLDDPVELPLALLRKSENPLTRLLLLGGSPDRSISSAGSPSNTVQTP